MLVDLEAVLAVGWAMQRLNVGEMMVDELGSGLEMWMARLVIEKKECDEVVVVSMMRKLVVLSDAQLWSMSGRRQGRQLALLLQKNGCHAQSHLWPCALHFPTGDQPSTPSKWVRLP